MNKSSKRDLEPLLLIALTLGATALLEPPRGAAQCTTTQSVPSIVIEKRVTTRDAISLPSVTMSNCAQFVIGFQDRSETNDEQHDVFFLRYDADTTTMAYSGDENGTVLSTQSAECTPVLPRSTKNEVISIAIGAATQPGGSPPLYATWTGKLNGLHGAYGEHSYRLRHPAANGQDPTTWTFDQTKPTPIRYSLCDENGDQAFNSAGMSSSETLIRTSAWTAIGAFLRTPPGLVAETPAFHRLRSVEMFNHRYNPCIATSQTGESVLVFAVPEDPSSVFSVLDIFIAQFDASGGVVPDPGTDAVGVQVNLPDPPDSFRSQESPAVSLVDDRIVVVFVGPDKTCPSKRRIYARRFEWGGSQVPATQPIPLDVEEFPVNDDLFADLVIGNPPLNNPTVSITTSTQPGNYGKFFVAWHTKPNATSSDIEIRGRYFNGDGTPETGEFRVNQTTQPTEPNGTTSIRYLSQSGQHSAVYGPDKQVVVTYTAGLDQAQGVYLTYLPPGYASTLLDACLAGDVTGDGLATGPDGNDIQPFVTYLFNGIPTNLSAAEQARIRCAMDCDRSAIIDACDIPVFIWLLLGLPTDGAYAGNCNNNCRPDYVDVARMIFPNGGCGDTPPFCPCEGDDCCLCALIPMPPGPVYVTPDCNTNGIDDSADIAGQTSVDCNSDGVPDECQLTWNDCNSNGVLDVCDVDPGDPDGNESVSADCNSNGIPDECDLVAIYFPSYDCNTNGIPDECDIAAETSADCNTNGIPDECDIAAEIKLDANTNGIPDECEEESMMMGGGGEGDGPSTGSGAGVSPYDNPAWETFWQWQADNAATLAAMSPWERFKATVDKLVELGLPAAIPWARASSP